MKIFVLTISVMAFWVSPTIAADYWPVGIDATYNYVNDEGRLLEVTCQANGTRIRRYIDYYLSYDFRVWENLSEDSDGNVFLNSTSAYSEIEIDPRYSLNFGFALGILNQPLVVGESWESVSFGLDLVFGGCTSHLLFEVLGESVVVVPAGSFQVLELAIENKTNCPADYYSGSIYLNREIGPVILPDGYKLVSVEGIVSTESKNWGTLKALYR